MHCGNTGNVNTERLHNVSFHSYHVSFYKHCWHIWYFYADNHVYRYCSAHMEKWHWFIDECGPIEIIVVPWKSPDHLWWTESTGPLNRRWKWEVSLHICGYPLKKPWGANILVMNSVEYCFYLLASKNDIAFCVIVGGVAVHQSEKVWQEIL